MKGAGRVISQNPSITAATLWDEADCRCIAQRLKVCMAWLDRGARNCSIVYSYEIMATGGVPGGSKDSRDRHLYLYHRHRRKDYITNFVDVDVSLLLSLFSPSAVGISNMELNSPLFLEIWAVDIRQGILSLGMGYFQHCC
jgi:hypothetical protein